jgi:glycosyltransferase involved in cell wall biosynthesis
VRILILSPEPPARGLLQALTARGVEPIVARARGETAIDGLIRHERVLTRGEPGDPMDLRWSRKGLRTLVRDTRPDLIHIIADPWTPTAEVGASAARDLKIPYVLVGTSSLGGARGLTARWQANRIRDGAAALGGITKPALEFLAAGTNTSIRAVLPQPGFEFPVHHVQRPASPIPVFGVVGRIVAERGIDLLFDALADVYGDWRVHIVGVGPAQEALEAQAQRLGLSSRIVWQGGIPRAELGPFWAEVDAFVAPSRSTSNWVEPTGSLVLEAMTHGIAPIVSRCGALPDVVGDAGMIFDENDRDALSRALSRIVEDPARCRAMGAAARQRALEHYGDGPIAERTIAVWRQVLAG